MSDAKEETSNTKETAAAPAKGSKKLLIIIIAVLLLGGGGGFYFFRIRASASPKTKEKSESKKSSKDKEAAADEESADEKDAKDEKEAKDEKGSSKKLLEMSLPEDADVKTVVELQPFIVNLADDGEARYLRMTVSVGLAETGESKPDPLFTTKVRNAMLAILTSKKSDEILTAEGKATLRKELLHAAQAAVAEPEVHAIYITDFIVQL